MNDPFLARIDPDRTATLLAHLLAAGRLDEAAPAVLVHDLDLLDARVDHLRRTFPDGALHAFAIKANPVVPLLRRLVDRGLGLEAASFEEVALGLAAGCPPERLVFDGPAKTRAELAEALRLGVLVNVDHFDELERVAALHPRGRVGLRVNPEVGAGSIAITSVGSRGARFGIPIHEEAVIQAAFEAYPWLDGLHVHAGSQGMALATMVEATARVAALADRLGRPLRLDIGGGLATTYREDRPAVGVDAWWQALSVIPGLAERPLVTELGRALVGNTALCATRVERVRPGGQVVVHVGADLLLRVAYRPEDWFHGMWLFDAQGRPKAGAVPQTVLGPLCFAGDVLARDRELPPAEPGDILVIRDVGAYTLSMWSRHCSRAMPEVVGLSGETLVPLRPRESVRDLVRFWGGEAP